MCVCGIYTACVSTCTCECSCKSVFMHTEVRGQHQVSSSNVLCLIFSSFALIGFSHLNDLSRDTCRSTRRLDTLDRSLSAPELMMQMTVSCQGMLESKLRCSGCLDCWAISTALHLFFFPFLRLGLTEAGAHQFVHWLAWCSRNSRNHFVSPPPQSCSKRHATSFLCGRWES